MFNLDPSKLLIVVAVALVVLGPDKLPAFMRSVGKYWNEFQKVRSRLQSEMNGAMSQITDAVGPISSAIDLGMNQIKGPFGAAAAFLSSAPVPKSEMTSKMTSDEYANENKGSLEASKTEPFAIGSNYVDTAKNMQPWSLVEGVRHPGLDSEPYWN